MLEIDGNFTSWAAENYSEILLTDASNLTYGNISEFIKDNVKRNTTPNILYTIMESLVAIVAVVGNGLVIIVFYRERRLRRRTNYYIISLALADLLVGLIGVPFAILVRTFLMMSVNF
jgi:membrane-associated PAP2 superfamily phosphatase